VLGRLLGAGAAYGSAAEWQQALARLHDQPAEVSRARRTAHVALHAAFVAVGVSALLVAGFPLLPGIPEHVTALLVSVPLFWVLWSFLWRGGVSFRVAGLALVGTDGRPAARWRCAWRTLLVWLPLTGLLLASVWLGEAAYRRVGELGAPSLWLLWLASWAAWGLGMLLLAAYVALATVFPARGPHDRLAGTCLVPK
jgi:hypothetical protein